MACNRDALTEQFNDPPLNNIRHAVIQNINGYFDRLAGYLHFTLNRNRLKRDICPRSRVLFLSDHVPIRFMDDNYNIISWNVDDTTDFFRHLRLRTQAGGVNQVHFPQNFFVDYDNNNGNLRTNLLTIKANLILNHIADIYDGRARNYEPAHEFNINLPLIVNLQEITRELYDILIPLVQAEFNNRNISHDFHLQELLSYSTNPIPHGQPNAGLRNYFFEGSHQSMNKKPGFCTIVIHCRGEVTLPPRFLRPSSMYTTETVFNGDNITRFVCRSSYFQYNNNMIFNVHFAGGNDNDARTDMLKIFDADKRAFKANLGNNSSAHILDLFCTADFLHHGEPNILPLPNLPPGRNPVITQLPVGLDIRILLQNIRLQLVPYINGQARQFCGPNGSVMSIDFNVIPNTIKYISGDFNTNRATISNHIINFNSLHHLHKRDTDVSRGYPIIRQELTNIDNSEITSFPVHIGRWINTIHGDTVIDHIIRIRLDGADIPDFTLFPDHALSQNVPPGGYPVAAPGMNIPTLGGDYKEKYLKYKAKYIALKKNQMSNK